ncbi:hypothetical protein SMACR_09508 [Sordaria macrospora]|uniref:Ankyrin repeat protein n=1 Tax=Sordaria macrospora TaxID=5147 RepID=A0A8S8ZC81_SORMA|nr:hypothetical protein SMACR_09508 [Sordaria macrospora]WPJ64076.1 hypothetical protein SMAC4_09508 [Sordaria macrospora]
MPAKKTRAKKAQATKETAKELPSPDTPPADSRSPFTNLPLEVHMLIGGTLKDKKQLGALAKLARTSGRLCSFYEQQLYKGKNCSNMIRAFMWGASMGSIPVMKTANGWGADLDTRTDLDCHSPYAPCRNTKGTALQLTIRVKQNDAMQWLLKQGVLVDVPNKPARNMCQCDGGWDRREIWASTLHIAICTGNLNAVKSLLRVWREGVAALEYSQKFDHDLILHTAVCQAFRYHSVEILDFVLKNVMIRKSIDGFKPNSQGGCTPLAMALLRGGAYYAHCSTKSILASLVKAGASLGPYPPASYRAGISPLMDEIERGHLRTNARYLLQLGCDPNGDRPDPVTQDWESPLHVYIIPQHENRSFRPPHVPSILPQWQGQSRREIKAFIVVLLKYGASLDITDSDGYSPLDNVLSYMEPFLTPGFRILGFKFVKFLLANVTDKGISEQSMRRAEDVMATMIQDLRAEHATHDLSYDYEGPLQEHHLGVWGEEEVVEEEPAPILLGWHSWTREGGRLVRK